jgi:hypothetical protein
MVHSATTGEEIPLPRNLWPRRSSRADMDTVVAPLVRLYQRGAVSDVRSVDVTRESDGGFRIDAIVDSPPLWETAFNLGASSDLGVVLWGRMAWPSLVGWRRWGLEVRLVAGRQGGVFSLETTPPGQLGGKLFARLVAARPLVPEYTTGGDLVGSRGYWFGAASLGVRTSPGPFGAAELSLTGRSNDQAALRGQPGDAGRELTIDMSWAGSWPRARATPSLGVAWSLGSVLPAAGPQRARVVFGSAGLHLPVGDHGRWSIDLLGAASEADRDRPLPLDRWTDPGGWWEAPGLLPGRGLAPSVRRGALALRRTIGYVQGAAVGVGASASAWRLGELRADPTTARNGEGYSIFVEGRTARFGPLILGAGRGSLEGSKLFLLFGPYRFPWPGPLPNLSGR